MEVAALPIPFYSDPAALGFGRQSSGSKTGKQLASAIRGGSPDEQVLQGELLKRNRTTSNFKSTDDASRDDRNRQQGEPIPKLRAALTGTLKQQNAINTYLDNSEPVNRVLADTRHLVDIFV